MNNDLTWHKQLETHGCIFSTVATDALVLKHQAISIHSADIVLQRFCSEILQFYKIILGSKITFWKKNTQLFKD